MDLLLTQSSCVVTLLSSGFF